MIFGDESREKEAKPGVARAPEVQTRFLGPALRATRGFATRASNILRSSHGDCSLSREIAIIKCLLFVLAKPVESARSSNIS